MAEFSDELASFTGAPYVVLTDCCTHAIELCLRYKKVKQTAFPCRTYLSVPMTMEKLGIKYELLNKRWLGEYEFEGTGIWDCARMLIRNMYRPGSMMCLSFGFDKPLSLGRGGAILLDDKEAYETLRSMGYDGRRIEITPWQEQIVFNVGYHYNMILENQILGAELIKTQGDVISHKKYPDLRKISIVNDS